MSFTGDLSSLYNAFVSKGVTPSAKTLTACINAVDELYNIGFENGEESVTSKPQVVTTATRAGIYAMTGGNTTGTVLASHTAGHYYPDHNDNWNGWVDVTLYIVKIELGQTITAQNVIYICEK